MTRAMLVAATLAGAALITSGLATATELERAAPAADSLRARGAPKRFALVVGNNTAPHQGMATLQYADDDAVKWAIVLRSFGTDVELLTALDPESARLYGSDAPPHHAPTRAELQAAMARLRASMKHAREDGSRTAFFFVYAGHGDVENGEAYVALQDGPFYRHDLEASVLTVSPADTNHVIIDACRSAYLAFDRGPGGSRRPWPEHYFGASAAARFPNTGFLLANSSGGASHEWEEFQAGIFSHELRSGLLGGADANGDGQITYRELSAFVRVANQAVRNEKYRPEMLAAPPRAGEQVLVTMGDAHGGRVHFGLGRTGRHVLEDGLGVRWADVHPGARQDLTLLVPGEASTRVFVRTEDGRTEYPVSQSADVALASVGARPSTVLRRGALHEAFALLFANPFDLSSLDLPVTAPQVDGDLTLVAGEPQGTKARRSLRPVAASLAVGSLASLALSGYLLWDASHMRSQNDSATFTGSERAALNTEIDTRNRWSIASALVGGTLAAAAVTLFLWDRRDSQSDSPPP